MQQGKVDLWISRLPLALIEWPKLCCLLVLCLTGLLVLFMENAQFDSSMDGFLENDNPHRKAYIDFKDQYGQSEYFILLIRSERIFTPEFKALIEQLSDDIQHQVPYVESVETIANARSIESKGDVIHVGQLFDELDWAPQWVMRDALTNPYYVNRLINERGDTTAVLIRLMPLIEEVGKTERVPMTLKEGQEALNALKAIVQFHQIDFEQDIVIGGSPMATIELTSKLKRDILVFSLSGLLVVSLFLMLFFRRLSAVFLPVISLLIAVTITMSLMIIGKYPIQVTSTILPSFLLAVCVGDAVHMLKAFYVYYDAGQQKKVALQGAIKHTASAMFFTTFMTSAGLLSFAHSSIKPIASFGLFSSVGVWLALVLTVVVLPSMMLLVPLKRYRHREAGEPPRWLISYSGFLIHYHKGIIFLASALLIGCFYLSTQLALSHDALSWLKPDNPTRQAVELVDSQLSGTMQVELLVAGDGAPLSVNDYQQLDQWLSFLQASPPAHMPIESVSSIIDLIKQIDSAFNQNGTLQLPESSELLAQEMLLLDLNAADDVARLCNSDCSEIRITLTTPWRDAVEYTDFLQGIASSFAEAFDSLLKLRMTGMATIVNKTFKEMLSSMFISYLIAASLVSFLMALFVRSAKLGLALMLPNLLPVFCVLALMYLGGMPLDLFSLLMGSIAIGLIVDDSVHLVSAFRQQFQQGQALDLAIARALQHTGSALTITTCVLCAGFLTYLLSDLQNIADFGLLTAICIALALLADVTVAPAVMIAVSGAIRHPQPSLKIS